jgi:predicted dehydrogenase
MNILIQYENGVTSSVEGGWYLPTQTGCIEDDFISIVSDLGVHEIRIPHFGYSVLGGDGVRFPNLAYGYEVGGIQYGPLRAAFDYMTTCISEGIRPRISTIQDALNAVELIEAAMLSVGDGRWVSREELK